MTLLIFQIVTTIMLTGIMMLGMAAFATLLVLELQLISKRNKRLKRRVK